MCLRQFSRLLEQRNLFNTVKGFFQGIHVYGAGDTHVAFSAGSKGVSRQHQHVGFPENQFRAWSAALCDTDGAVNTTFSLIC